MHKLMPGLTILDHELSELRLLVERQIGVLLDCPNSALAAHVAEFLESENLDSSAALLSTLRASDRDPSMMARFLDGILNVTTGFFRHPSAMSALTNYVIPQLCNRRSDDGPATLRVWSAGCATGEEAYSIAMAICQAMGNGNGTCTPAGTNGNRDPRSKTVSRGIAPESVPANSQMAKDWSIHIVGTDLLPSAIAAAERGLYPQSEVDGLPPAMIRSSFSRIGNSNGGQTGNNGKPPAGAFGREDGVTNGSANGDSNGCAHLLVKPRLRSLVTFNTMNLTKPVYIGRFDCIFCMDVLPHLSRNQRTALVERLHLYLEPGGYLFLSQTEKLCAPNLNFRPEVFDGYTVHRKPLAAGAAYGR
jgi:two-component system CheB/CheR fusion protein